MSYPYIYKIVCNQTQNPNPAPPPANQDTATGAFKEYNPPFVQRETITMRAMRQYQSGDSIEFQFVFPAGTTFTAEQVKAYINLSPLVGCSNGGEPRNMTIGTPFVGEASNVIVADISLGGESTDSSTNDFFNTQPFTFAPVNGRWCFSIDIYDGNGNLYHLDDPEIQVGTGNPTPG